MSQHPAFILVNENLTYDPSQANLCTDEPHISYGLKAPTPPPPTPTQPTRAKSGFGCSPCHGFAKTAVALKSLARKQKITIEESVARECRDHERKPISRDKEELYELRLKVAKLRERAKLLETMHKSAAHASREELLKIKKERDDLLAEIDLVLSDYTKACVRIEALEEALVAYAESRTLAAWLMAGGAALGVLTALLAVPKHVKVVGFGLAGVGFLTGLAILVTPIPSLTSR